MTLRAEPRQERRQPDSAASATPLRRVWLAGLGATLAIAVGSYGAGALPANDPTRRIPLLGLLRHGAAGLHVALGLYYLGLIAFVISWLLIGRTLLTADLRARGFDHQTFRRMIISWMVPLLAAMPIASTDLYSYAAQAQLSRRGFDPYTATPADLPGKFLDNVAWKWVDTPSPYGPMWVAVSRWAAALTGNHALISVLLLRLLPFAALVVITVLLPRLARRFSVRADIALWLVAANPLMMVHGIGGGHNDVVMVAFVLAAIWVVSRPGAGAGQLLAAAALGTLAGAVKAPGLIAVVFIVPLYLRDRTWPTSGARARELLRCCAAVAGVAVAVFGAVSLVAGVGLGWTRQVNTSVPVINFMSIPTMLAVAYRLCIGAPHAGTVVDQTVRNFREAGSIASALALVAIWVRATLPGLFRPSGFRPSGFRPSGSNRPFGPGEAFRRSGPAGAAAQTLGWLTLGLTSVVVLSPAVQPWYLLWALSCLALLRIRATQLTVIATASIALSLLTRPMGSSLEMAIYLPAVLAAALATRALLGITLTGPSAPASLGTETAPDHFDSAIDVASAAPTRADLTRADLTGADFARADLTRAVDSARPSSTA